MTPPPLPRIAERAFFACAGVCWAAKVAVDSGAPAWILSLSLLLAGVSAAAGALVRKSGSGWLDGWRLAVILLALLDLPSVYPRLGGDGYQCYVLLRSPLLDHDLEFTNDYEGLGTSPVISAQGEATSRFPIGTAIVWLPPFLLAHLGATLASWFGSGIPADGFSAPYQSAVTSATFFYGVGALLLLEAALRRRYGPAVAGLTVISLWLATPLHFYMVANPFMSHAPSASVATLFVLAWLEARDRVDGRAWALVGVAGGLMCIIRPQDGVLLAAPLVDLLVGRRPGRLRLAALYVAGPFLLGLAQLLVWLRFYGLAFLQVISTQSYVGHTGPQVLDLLFSARHGLFTWTPLYLAAAAGWVLWTRKDVRLAGLFALGFVGAVFVNSSMEDWWGSDSFGQRRMLGMTPIFAWGLAETLQFLFRRPAVLAAGILASLAVWNLQFAYIYNTSLVARRNEAVSLDRLAAAQVEVLYQRVLGWQGRLPDRVWLLLYENVKGVWLDEGPRSLDGGVDLGAEPPELALVLGDGWHRMPGREGDTTFRRSKGKRSSLRIPIRTVGDFRAVLRVRPESTDVRVQLSLEVNGEALGQADLAPGWSDYSFAVPRGALRPGINTVALVYSTTPKPPGHGRRGAAVDVDSLRLEREEPLALP